MSRIKFVGFCCAALLIIGWKLSGAPRIGPSTQTLVVQEQAHRIVIGWSGPVAPPMRDQILSAVQKYKSDSRPLVIALNSPGGSLAHGREVMETIRSVSQSRPIYTLVENGSVCASMCVPIYLVGAMRIADPAARFMFHKANIHQSESPEVSADDRKALSILYKIVENGATDEFFSWDMAKQRVAERWLAAMRSKIEDRDIWLTGQQLVAEGSGIIDKLEPTVVE